MRNAPAPINQSGDSDGSSLEWRNTVELRWMLHQGKVCCRWRTSHMRTQAALLPRVAPLTFPPVLLELDYHREAWEAVRPYAARISDFRIWGVSHAGNFALFQEGNTSEDWSNLESLQIEIVVDLSRGEIKGESRNEDLPRLKYLNGTPPGYLYGTTSVASLEESS
ncbi:hypothetical protein C8Q74DRAFT_1433896 [Fomes fomentarius]|nr:hypothetical protein C8Q74DRAFT_1433896 [Fomes fomentarius]